LLQRFVLESGVSLEPFTAMPMSVRLDTTFGTLHIGRFSCERTPDSALSAILAVIWFSVLMGFCFEVIEQRAAYLPHSSRRQRTP